MPKPTSCNGYLSDFNSLVYIFCKEFTVWSYTCSITEQGGGPGLGVECNLNPLFVSLLKHVGMRRLLEINDDRKQYHHFPPLVHISLCSLDILKIFFAHDISLLFAAHTALWYGCVLKTNNFRITRNTITFVCTYVIW